MKQFTLVQLFSIVDGRLSTEMKDIYDMLNHIFNANLFTHELPEAFNKLKKLKPDWFIEVQKDLKNMGATKDVNFETCFDLISKNNKIYNISQL